MFDLMNVTLTPADILPLFLYDDFFVVNLLICSWF